MIIKHFITQLMHNIWFAETIKIIKYLKVLQYVSDHRGSHHQGTLYSAWLKITRMILSSPLTWTGRCYGSIFWPRVQFTVYEGTSANVTSSHGVTCQIWTTFIVISKRLQVGALASCTASLTFNNPTFCPHSVFMCFVWISEQTTIISLYNINWLAFINEMKSNLSNWPT